MCEFVDVRTKKKSFPEQKLSVKEFCLFGEHHCVRDFVQMTFFVFSKHKNSRNKINKKVFIALSCEKSYGSSKI